MVTLVEDKRRSVIRQRRWLPVRFVIGPVLWIAAVLALPIDGSAVVGEELSIGTGARKQRQDILEKIPFARLNEAAKRKVSGVLDKPSMYRNLPRMAIQIDPDYLQFLIRHPEVIVNIWELMGITDMQAKRIGPYSLQTDDGAGTTSNMELVFGSQSMHIYYGRGQYEGPVLRKKLKAECVIVVQTTPRPAQRSAQLQPAANPAIVPNDRQMVCQLDVFVKIENAAAGLVVRTIQPIVGPTADHNFIESMKFIQRLNETTEDNGYGVQAMGGKLSVDPQVQEKFIAIAGTVHQRALNREADQRDSSYDINFDRSNYRDGAGRSSTGAQPLNRQRYESEAYRVKQSNFIQPGNGWHSDNRPAFHQSVPQWHTAPDRRYSANVQNAGYQER